MLSALTHGLSFVVALVACIPLLTDAYQADRFTFWRCVSVLDRVDRRDHTNAGAASPTKRRYSSASGARRSTTATSATRGCSSSGCASTTWASTY